LSYGCRRCPRRAAIPAEFLHFAAIVTVNSSHLAIPSASRHLREIPLRVRAEAPGNARQAGRHRGRSFATPIAGEQRAHAIERHVLHLALADTILDGNRAIGAEQVQCGQGFAKL